MQVTVSFVSWLITIFSDRLLRGLLILLETNLRVRHSQLSLFCFFNFNLVVNWYFFEELNHIVFVFFSFICIFWSTVQPFIWFCHSCDFVFSAGIIWLWCGKSSGTWWFKLNVDIPIVRRLTISRKIWSSTKLNLSSLLTQSALLLDWDRYSNIPKHLEGPYP